jgi:protein SCO1
MNGRRRAVLHSAAQPLIGLSALLALALFVNSPSAATSSVTIGGPFTLSTADGLTVTDQTYRGKWLLVYFGYTFCPNSCPTTLFEVAAALKELGAAAARVQPLFITVDPQRDTPKVLRQFTQSFDPRIVGLTGTAQQIAAAAHEYGAYYVRHATGSGDDDYVVDHSTYLYVMDPQGKFVRAFENDTSANRIAEVLRLLLTQEPHEGMKKDGGAWSLADLLGT